jgi:hypothetical protein
MYQLAAEARVHEAAGKNAQIATPAVRLHAFDACLQDRFARTVAWEQRHEQILNDANQTLAHAGGLPLGSGPPKPPTNAPSNAPTNPQGDPCDSAFEPGNDTVATAVTHSNG